MINSTLDTFAEYLLCVNWDRDSWKIQSLPSCHLYVLGGGDHGNADSDMSRIRRAGAWDSSWRETSPRAAELHDGRVAEIFLEGDNNQ